MEVDLIDDQDSLEHHGILGQKWGVRRFQNYDGSLMNVGQFKRHLTKKKIDVLDTLNRKGVLDFLDSKASDSFTATRTRYSSIEAREDAERGVTYISKSKQDPFRAMENINRYLNLNRSTELFNASRPQMIVRDHDQDKFSDAMKKLTDPSNKDLRISIDNWVRGISSRSMQSIEDKQLGMTSKTVRDMKRSVEAKKLIDRFNEEEWDVSKLTDRWFKTDFRGNQPRFQGETYTKETVKIPDEIDFVDVAPGEARMRVKSWKDELQVTGYTDQFIDWKKSMVMPSNYSHVTDQVALDYVSNIMGMLDKTGVWHEDMMDDFLAHHGIKGQKWGRRRYQNGDGSLTEEGRKHYGVGEARKTLSGVAASVGSAIRKKVNPTKEDLQEQYQKALEKQEKKQLKNAIREASGKSKKLSDMTNEEVVQEYNRKNLERQIRRMNEEEKANSTLGKTKAAAIKGAELTAIGAKFVGGAALKVGGAVVGGTVKIGGTLAREAILKAGRNAINSRLMTESERIKQRADDSRNLLDTLRNTNNMERESSDAYRTLKEKEMARDLTKANRDILDNQEYIRNKAKKSSRLDDQISQLSKQNEAQKLMLENRLLTAQIATTSSNKDVADRGRDLISSYKESKVDGLLGGNKNKKKNN